MGNRLEDQDLRAMGHAAVEWAADYCDGLRDRPLVRRTTAAEVRGLLDWSLPQNGCEFSVVFTTPLRS